MKGMLMKTNSRSLLASGGIPLNPSATVSSSFIRSDPENEVLSSDISGGTPVISAPPTTAAVSFPQTDPLVKGTEFPYLGGGAADVSDGESSADSFATADGTDDRSQFREESPSISPQKLSLFVPKYRQLLPVPTDNFPVLAAGGGLRPSLSSEQIDIALRALEQKSLMSSQDAFYIGVLKELMNSSGDDKYKEMIKRLLGIKKGRVMEEILRSGGDDARMRGKIEDHVKVLFAAERDEESELL